MFLDFLVALLASHRRDRIVGGRSLRDVAFAFAADTVVPNVASIGLDISRGSRPPNRGESNAVVHIWINLVVVVSVLCRPTVKRIENSFIRGFG